MKITVEFDSEDEFKARIKNPRGGKAGADADSEQPTSQAPAPIQPPAQQQSAAFTPAAFTPPQSAFPSAPALDPLVGRIVTRIDSAIASGQPADAVLTWFRTQAGAGAENATMDQIKTVFLPKMPMPSLENIAKLMNA